MKISFLILIYTSICISNSVQGQNAINRTDTLLNTSEYLVLGHSKGNIKIVNKEDKAKHPSYKVLSKYKDDLILGLNITFNEVDIYRKHKPIASFEDYTVDVFKGELADPNFESNPDAKMFISTIKTACEDGINFAGHYTLAEWGCGTACQSGVIVNRKTGVIYDRPTTSLGLDYKANSNLIIRNYDAIDTKTKLIWVSGYSKVSVEVWNGNNFVQIK